MLFSYRVTLLNGSTAFQPQMPPRTEKKGYNPPPGVQEAPCALIKATSTGVDEGNYSFRLPAKHWLPLLLALVQMR